MFYDRAPSFAFRGNYGYGQGQGGGTFGAKWSNNRQDMESSKFICYQKEVIFSFEDYLHITLESERFYDLYIANSFDLIAHEFLVTERKKRHSSPVPVLEFERGFGGTPLSLPPTTCSPSLLVPSPRHLVPLSPPLLPPLSSSPRSLSSGSFGLLSLSFHSSLPSYLPLSQPPMSKQCQSVYKYCYLYQTLLLVRIGSGFLVNN